MKKLSEQNITETKVVNKLNPRIEAYLESDLHILSPLFKVLNAVEHQAEANYVMTTLIKFCKVQLDKGTTFTAYAVINAVAAFKGSTKSDKIINSGINECERLSLIKYDGVKKEIIMFNKCFNDEYVI